MRCLNCDFANPEGTKFCIECGIPLKKHCPSCGSENLPQAKFCGECGVGLTGQPAISNTVELTQQQDLQKNQALSVKPPLGKRRAPEGERRQLTVLFCDLVGSTALSAQLDPEELREVIHAYQEVCTEVIQRFEGHIAQYLGDGLLVYFGYPLAHEDDAQRAVRTGLSIVEALGQLHTRLEREQGIQLAVRVGIHTGLVVVGDIGSGDRQEQLALGETPNVAARLQSLAMPNTVVISAATHRLVQGFFTLEALGPSTLKGIATPLHVYRVLDESAVQSRLEVAATRGLTPLVGRESEVMLLLERWQQVKKGRGQVVLLSGEAGIGKSRIVKVVKDYLTSELHSQAEVRCSAYYQNSALYPIIDLLQRALQFQRDDTSADKLRKIEEMLGQYGLPLPETVPLFAVLLSIPLNERYVPLHLSPQRQKQKTLEALLALRLAIAEQHPVLYIVEDLHWADPSTLEWLGLLLEQVPTNQIFVLLTCRPEFYPPWNMHLTQLTLSRFGQEQVEEMVSKITGGKTLPDEVLQQIVAKTDGVPLFVEELTKTVLESGLLQEQEDHYELSGPLPPLAIPTTLHDSLMARLDRLTTVKGVAQLGAMLGRTFSYELLQAVSPLDETILQQALAQLVEAELLYQRGVPPQTMYIFKHALIQEAAYQSLLRSTRQQYHQQIAQVLEARFPEIVQTQPELLAHHYTEAGLNEQAVGYWHRAGQHAIERSANVEAIAHFRKGLEVLKALPDAPERTQKELDLLTALGPALAAIKGFSAPEVVKTYNRARELCRKVGEIPQLFPVLRGLWEVYDLRAEMKMARELAEQLLTLAQRVQDSAFLLVAHEVLGETVLWLGEFALAREHQEQAIALYDHRQHRSLAFLYGGYDPGVACRSFVAHVLWYLGYPDQALRKSQEAIALAQELSHPHSFVFALAHAGFLHHLRREVQAAQERAEAGLMLSHEQGFVFWVWYATILQGRALVAQGQGEEGIAQIRQGLAGYRATGAELECPYFVALLIEALGRMEQIEEGLTVLAEMLVEVDRTRVRFHEAELQRLKGELLLKQRAKDERGKGEKGAETEGDEQHVENSLLHVSRLTHHTETITEAETCFHQALDIARYQQAKSLELRAAMSLSRLWQQQGKCKEARQLLAEVYGWFTEGFDTADLKEAKALLEELS